MYNDGSVVPPAPPRREADAPKKQPSNPRAWGTTGAPPQAKRAMPRSSQWEMAAQQQGQGTSSKDFMKKKHSSPFHTRSRTSTRRDFSLPRERKILFAFGALVHHTTAL